MATQEFQSTTLIAQAAQISWTCNLKQLRHLGAKQ